MSGGELLRFETGASFAVSPGYPFQKTKPSLQFGASHAGHFDGSKSSNGQAEGGELK